MNTKHIKAILATLILTVLCASAYVSAPTITNGIGFQYGNVTVGSDNIQIGGANVTKTATVVVAASDSLHPEQADYVCDGVDDQVEIQAAIDNAGDIYLMGGHYSKSNVAPITIGSHTHVHLAANTEIKFTDSVGDGAVMFANADSTNENILIGGGGILDGNKANNTGSQTAISLSGVHHSKICVKMRNFRGYNVVESNSRNNVIKNAYYPDAYIQYDNSDMACYPPAFPILTDDTVAMDSGSEFDATCFFTYPKSIKMTASDLWTSPAKVYQTFSPSLNLTDSQLHVMARQSDQNTNHLRFLIQAPNYANRFEIRQSITQKIVGEWVLHSFSFADATASGTPDITNVTRIDLYAYSNSGETSITHIDKAFITKTTETPSGVVSFVFDDALRTVYTAGFEIFEKHGYSGSIAVIPKRIDDGLSDYMTLEMLHEMQFAGWDMLNHGYNHLYMDGYSLSECEDDIGIGKQWLINNNLGHAADHYVYPNTIIDENGLNAIKKYELTGRVGDSVANTLPVMDKFTLHTVHISNHPIADIETMIDNTMTNKSWLIIYGHDIDESGDTPPNDLDTLLGYCRTNDVPVVPISTVWNNYRKW